MKKILLTITTIIMIMSIGMCANATEHVVGNVGSHDIPIQAEVISSFEITIPSIITLTDEYISEFDIKGKGIVTKYEYIGVSIPTSVHVSSDGQYGETLAIISDGDRFTKEQLTSDEGGIIHCSINAKSLPTGVWNGEVLISISLEDMYYRIPDTITYSYPYTTVSKWGKDIYLWNHSTPLYYYEPKSGYSEGYITGGSSGNNTNKYILQSDGSWKLDTGNNALNDGSVGRKISLSQQEILYSNYDIYYISNTSQLWHSKMCPE